MNYSAEDQSKIAIWRQKSIDGTLTIDDCRDYVALMRQGRTSAIKASEASRKSRAKKEVKSADDLLKTLGI